MAGSELASALLKEAQQEIALLRTDLFNTRRLAEERRQAVDALQAERERLLRHCDDVEASLRAANVQLNHVPEILQRCSQLEASLQRSQTELETSIAARRILEQELSDERRHRAAITEQKAIVEGERSRLAKQRDDLAAQLRVEQKKAREAEEEQVRAEEDAAALRSEIAALQHASATVASAPPPPPNVPNPSSTSSPLPSPTDTAAVIAASVAAATAPLLEQLEHERARGTALLGSLHAAKAEIMDLSQRVADYEVRMNDMLARGYHDPEHLGHQITLLREENAALSAQLATYQERARALEAEAQELRTTAAEAAAAAAAAVDAAAVAAAATGSLGNGNDVTQQGTQHPTQQPSMASRLLGLAGRITSSGSLYGGTPITTGGGGIGDDGGVMPDGTTAGGSSSSLCCAAATADAGRLRQQVARLKASRDKLLAEIDKQWGEIERLSVENVTLGDELRAARALATNWERQAQDGIVQVDQLKDLLEDSAGWGMAAAVAAAMPPAAAAGGLPSSDPRGGPATVQSLQQQLLSEKARAADLELQLRALAAELLRCQHGSRELGKSFLPMMAGVEKRLGELLRKTRVGEDGRRIEAGAEGQWRGVRG